MTFATVRPIAISGATGEIGSRVASHLGDQGVPTRLLVRDAARARSLPGEVRVFTGYRDRAAVTALRGCGTLFLVSARESVDRVSEHRAMVDAAVEAGVDTIVYLSFQGAAEDCTFTFGRDHWHTEQHIRASGLNFTFLRDSLYLAGLAMMAGPDGVIRGPGGAGTVAAVDHDDVAAVAVAALRDPALRGRTLEVTGPAAVSLQQVADELGEVSGRPVRYVDETVEEAYASRAHYQAPSFAVDGWVSSYQAIARGELAAVATTVPEVTGRAATGLRDFLRRHPRSWRHLRVDQEDPRT